MLKEIYSGKFNLGDRRRTEDGRHIEIVNKIEELETYLDNNLKTGDRYRIKRLSDLYAELMAIEEENAFSYGFAMGALMMMDIMEELPSGTI